MNPEGGSITSVGDEGRCWEGPGPEFDFIKSATAERLCNAYFLQRLKARIHCRDVSITLASPPGYVNEHVILAVHILVIGRKS